LRSSTDTARRLDGWTAGGFLTVLCLLTVCPSSRLLSQGVLDQFSYDNLQPTGLRFELGPLGASKLKGALLAGVRFDAGNIAPRVRVLLGLSYFRSGFDQQSLNDFASRIRSLVHDPDSNFTVSVGQIRWSDLAGDLDLQYAFPQGTALTTFLGAGVGVHWRHGSGSAIDGTFVQDALDGLFPAVNFTVGAEVRVAPRLALSFEGRGVLSDGLASASLSAGLMYRFHGWGSGGGGSSR